MHIRLIIISLFSATFLLVSCSPKTGSELSESKTNPQETVKPKDETPVNPRCFTFDQSPYPDDAINAHVIYRAFINKEEYPEALPYWRTAYSMAPAADGMRTTHYSDGARLYRYLFEGTTDDALKTKYVDSVRLIYDHGIYCNPRVGNLMGMKAFDLYYYFKDYSSDKEIYDLFSKNIDMDGLKTNAFVLNPYADVLIRMINEGAISKEEGYQRFQEVTAILKEGLANSKEKASFEIVASYAPQRLEELEAIEDFFPAAYYLERYYPEYLADSTNCEVVNSVYSRFSWGKVDDSDPRMKTLANKVSNDCRIEESLSSARQAYNALQVGKYREAVRGFDLAISETDDSDKKARFNLINAQIYYAYLKSFDNSRKYALNALKFKPNWGEPYLLIGKLYASSGPLCGPGRGWDSQIVTWAAIDKWVQAKSLDAAVSAEANKLINQYTVFMPSREDVFQRGLKEGQSFKVGCWIQETTTIRTSK
jgi:hypothetical protein